MRVGDPNDEYDEDDEELANKYRVSWNKASEAQKQALCNRLGIVYTNVDDDQLLIQVAKRQQAEYIRSKQTVKQERNELVKAMTEPKTKLRNRRIHSRMEG